MQVYKDGETTNCKTPTPQIRMADSVTIQDTITFMRVMRIMRDAHTHRRDKK